MTFEEFKVMDTALRADIDKCHHEIEVKTRELYDLPDKYAEEHRKFANGTCVTLKRSQSANPTKYYIKDAEGVSYNDHIDIRYHLTTKNGCKVNGGWSVSETSLNVVNK